MALRYYDNYGARRAEHLDCPGVLGPMASTEIFLQPEEFDGEVGANMIVEWQADNPVTPPLAEVVIIGRLGTLGYSFTSRGVVLDEWR